MRKHFLVQNLLLQTSGSDPQLSPLGFQTHKRFGLTLEQILYECHLRAQELQELLEGEKISVVSTARTEQMNTYLLSAESILGSTTAVSLARPFGQTPLTQFQEDAYPPKQGARSLLQPGFITWMLLPTSAKHELEEDGGLSLF